jgi:hypothetical protein
MNLKDYMGRRGENIFTVLITKWCNGKPLFTDNFLGEKHETTDFLVELINPTCGHGHFYVQVKATTANYSGTGTGRKLDVQVTKDDVEKLKQIHAPCYIVGVDIENVRGYIASITQQNTVGLSGISIRNSLTCPNLKRLWKEVDTYWTAKTMLAATSIFSN